MRSGNACAGVIRMCAEQGGQAFHFLCHQQQVGRQHRVGYEAEYVMEIELHFPTGLRDSEIKTIREAVSGQHLYPLPVPEGYSSWEQALLDELGGAHEATPLVQPVLYFLTLVRACKEGHFIPQQAYRVLARRLNERVGSSPAKFHSLGGEEAL